jgi:preprotein translocase subunit SecA
MHGEAMRSKWTAALGDLASSFYAQWEDARAKHRPTPAAFEEAPRDEASHADALPFKRAAPKLGRNEPCHCGSGKKYKQCHGKP